MTQRYDRFNLEEEIQSVWSTVEDLDTILYRIMDASEGPPSEDDITTMLMGLKEIHNSRCMKLWDVFETMVQQKNSFLTEEVTMGDVLDKIVDDAGKDEEWDRSKGIPLTEEEAKIHYNRRPNESNTRI